MNHVADVRGLIRLLRDGGVVRQAMLPPFPGSASRRETYYVEWAGQRHALDAGTFLALSRNHRLVHDEGLSKTGDSAWRLKPARATSRGGQ